VDKQQTPEEKLKAVIYDIYILLFNEIVSDRRQVYCGQIWEKIVKWCDKYNYLKINANNMGVEIYNVINRLVKDNNETVKNKSEFFSILKKSMENAENEYFRTFGQGSIHIPREKRRMLKELNELIRIEEDQRGRKLTKDEEDQYISKWFIKQEYIDLINAEKVGSISYINKEKNDKNDGFDIEDTHLLVPLEDLINKANIEDDQRTIMFLLDKKQDRNRDCDRALFTLYCIENKLKGLYPILDQEIIDSVSKYGKELKQYEIYQKYHPDIDNKSAGVMASTNLKKFLNDIETCLKNKN